jgi:hypothetical protein
MSGLVVEIWLNSNMKKLSVLLKSNKVIYYKLQFYLFDVQSLVAYFAPAPSQLF